MFELENPGWYTHEGLARAHHYDAQCNTPCGAKWTIYKMREANGSDRRCDRCANAVDEAAHHARIDAVALMVELGADPKDAPVILEQEPEYTKAWLNGDFGHYRSASALIQFLSYALIKKGTAFILARNKAERRGEAIQELKGEVPADRPAPGEHETRTVGDMIKVLRIMDRSLPVIVRGKVPNNTVWELRANVQYMDKTVLDGPMVVIIPTLVKL